MGSEAQNFLYLLSRDADVTHTEQKKFLQMEEKNKFCHFLLLFLIFVVSRAKYIEKWERKKEL